MRTLLKWALVALGATALARWWRERRASRVAQGEPPAPASADPKEELRRTLAASRSLDASTSQAMEETPLDERRAEVHAEAMAAIDEMRSTDGAR
ncbi:MAG: hypothetical protein RMM28_03165 [Thermoleophilia bacterium]|nr:hypothetical protein [Thermoleophilia bacterium]